MNNIEIDLYNAYEYKTLGKILEFSAQLSVWIKYFGCLTVVSYVTTILNICTIISKEFENYSQTTSMLHLVS